MRFEFYGRAKTEYAFCVPYGCTRISERINFPSFGYIPLPDLPPLLQMLYSSSGSGQTSCYCCYGSMLSELIIQSELLNKQAN